MRTLVRDHPCWKKLNTFSRQLFMPSDNEQIEHQLYTWCHTCDFKQLHTCKSFGLRNRVQSKGKFSIDTFLSKLMARSSIDQVVRYAISTLDQPWPISDNRYVMCQLSSNYRRRRWRPSRIRIYSKTRAPLELSHFYRKRPCR